MDDFNKNPAEYLIAKLNSKGRLKQTVWKNALHFFAGLKKEAQILVEELKEVGENDASVPLDIQSNSEFEFHIFFGSDMVVFALQTNVVTFNPSHPLMQDKYLQQDPERCFFGQVMIYDFMADSLRYNRPEDTGYLMGRVLVNKDNHFMIEGVRGLHYLFEGIEKNESTSENHSMIVKKSLAVAVDSDLLAPDFSQVQFVKLGVRMKGEQELGHGQKIGFQLNDDEEENSKKPGT